MKRTLIVITMLITISTLASCQSDAEAYDIVTTLFPQYDIAKTLAEDDFTVHTILPLGASPHGYEVTSQDIETMSLSHMLIYTSDAVDPWVQDLNLGDTVVINLLHEVEKHVTLDLEHTDDHAHEEDHDHDGEDPHYWTHPEALLEMIEIIAAQMITMKPELESAINARALQLTQAFEAEFKLLSDDLALLNLNDAKIYVAGHNAVAYYAYYYDLHVESLFPDFVPDAELTSSQLETFINIIKQDQVSYFFIEPLFETQPLAANAIVNGLTGENYSIEFEELYQFHNLGKSEYEDNATLLTLLSHNRISILLSLEKNHAHSE